MRILVIGSGAREHALLRALRRDPAVTALAVAPGNAGTAVLADTHPVDVADPTAITELAVRLGVDLVVIGPEVPLVAGAADALAARGIAAFGPSAAAARIEGSKAFAKDVMAAAGVATAEAVTVTHPDGVSGALAACGAPYVVKDDGLAAGKGVVVTPDLDVATEHARAVLDGGHPVLVEEFLAGPEVSLFAVCDGERAVPLLPAQDFKRRDDGDAGPNTGGMGAYAPLPWAPVGLVDTVMRDVVDPVLAEMSRRGTPFVGLLYAGLVLTVDGPKVIEFNCRFGDPETQVVLELLDTPLGALLMAAATGRLDTAEPLAWRGGSAVTVVVAAPGYPQAPTLGGAVTGLDGDLVLHAGTRRDADGTVRSTGGRVVSVVGTGDDLAAARVAAYAAVDRIRLDGAHHRTDIALAAQEGLVAVPGTP
ncbi:phosphoribosylamine--glycine ligase [Nakamurella flavida]|uniref:Phosphoribosylamine--glycine ligase n=1 Tax=Nakamurella flavida TaxID=363630 RepID=A0A939C1D1_9ACTN|nr:phosphoribosylamine--glycine ligase [Nakamurella flavida]MBM9477568.1 phosphoribosylamine--glycine ligase [Nakamurella flavida]MDP9779116.1 phosphoribosylamine--glycine ligase [Nakamurella flavida]